MAAFDDYVDVTVEMGFGSGPLAASPSWTDVSQYVKAASWFRGRSSVQADFPAGSGTLWLDNSDGRFYPHDTGGAYSPNVTVGVPVRITVTYTSAATGLTEKANSAAVTLQGDAELVSSDVIFYGYVASWPTKYPTNEEELAVAQIVETVARLNEKKVTGSYTLEDSEDRVGNLLDDASWPAGRRDLDAGVAECAAVSVEQSSVLELLRQATEAEQGQLFQAQNGDLRFLNRVAASSVSSQYTFGPAADELTYEDVTVTHDDDLLYNEALIVGSDETEESSSDATSISDHGPSTYSATNPQIVGPAGSLNVAEWVVAKYKDIEPRVTGLRLDPAGYPDDLWAPVFSLDLRDVITVEVSFPGASVQLVQAVAVESVAHSFTAGGVWTVEYGCHPLSDLEQEVFWILGTSDDLDTDTILA